MKSWVLPWNKIGKSDSFDVNYEGVWIHKVNKSGLKRNVVLHF
jgi:hypothetical protein